MVVSVRNVKKIFSNGQHNAFTSLCRYGEYVYVAFRNASGHLKLDGRIFILRSLDLETWEQVAELSDLEGDLRDPRLVNFCGRLLVYSGKCFYAAETRHAETTLFVSEDGKDFSRQSVRGIDKDLFVWGFAQQEGKLFCTAYYVDCQAKSPVMLYSSKDGKNWEMVCVFPVLGNETAIDFDEDGRLFALVRNEYGTFYPKLCVYEPGRFDKPVSMEDIPLRFQGPMMKCLDGGLLLIGRTWDCQERNDVRIEVFWKEDGKELVKLTTLPSGGDCSYASWLTAPDKKVLLSYYSAHEHLEAFLLEKDNVSDPKNLDIEHSTPADIFLAELVENAR